MIDHPAAVRLREGLRPDSSSSISLLAARPVLEGEADAHPQLPVAVVLDREDKDGERERGVGVVVGNDRRDLPADDPDAYLISQVLLFAGAQSGALGVHPLYAFWIYSSASVWVKNLCC